MSIYSKPVAKITTEDLEELLQGEAVENVRLEFKQKDPDKENLVKKLSSFANTYGGWMVVGAKEINDGKLAGLPGVEKISGYKQRVIQWCFDQISPPIHIEVSDPIATPLDSERFCYIISVPESELAPHFINGRKGIYVRTDEFSQRFEPKLATLTEILQLSDRRRSILDRRHILIERAKRRFESHVETSYSKHDESSEGIGGHLILVLTPRYPHDRLFDPQDLLKTIRSERINWREFGFPIHHNQNLISQHESVLMLDPGSRFSLLEASVWGLLAYSTEIERPNLEGIHLNHFLGQLLAFCKHAQHILSKVGYLGSLYVTLDLRNIRGVPWIPFPGNSTQKGPNSVLDDSVSISLEVETSKLLEDRDSFVADLLRQVFFALNWSEAVSTQERLETLFRLGYTYNHWEYPSSQ